MTLVSIRLANFRCPGDVRRRELAEEGPVAVALPPGRSQALLLDALRFALVGGGAEPTRLLAPGAGHGFVVLVLRSPGGGELSLFRGVDRHGRERVSLREGVGGRLLAGGEAVAARLAEALGAAPERFLAAACIEELPADPEGLAPPPGNPERLPRASAPTTSEQVEAATAEPLEALRRALRVQALDREAERDLAAIVELAAILRRERAEIALDVSRRAAHRERTVARLRRLEEYRELVARGGPPSGTPEEPRRSARASSPLVRPLGTCAAACVLLFLLVAFGDPRLRAGNAAVLVGAGAAVSMGSFLFAALRRSPGPGRDPSASLLPPSPPASAEPWLAALRARFHDLPDPDAPGLAEVLRARVTAAEAELGPLRERLERVDEAAAAADVEAARAARTLRRRVPAAPDRLPDAPLPLDEVRARAAALGDAVYQARVERDALLAAFAPGVAEAARAVVESALGLAREAGAEAEAAVRAVLEDHGLPALSAGAAELLSEPGPLPQELPRALLAALGGAPEDADESVPLLPDLVAGATRGRFRGVSRDASVELVLHPASGPPLPWTRVDAADRERVALALRALRSERALGSSPPPRFVVLARVPAGLEDEAELAEQVRAAAPSVRQVVFPRSAKVLPFGHSHGEAAPAQAVPVVGPRLRARRR